VPQCPFCQIVSGELSSAVVFRDDSHVAFLDHRPLFHGHVLVVPRRHVMTLPELEPDEVGALFLLVRLIAAALPAGLGCEGTFVALNNVVSQSVPHLHVHVVPRTKGDGLRGFFWPRTSYESAEQMEEVREKVSRALGS
jgi:histidine triad (HIT) family protein